VSYNSYMVQDFRAQYLEQLSFIRSSASAYDAGEEHEAKRLALGVRILVHDKGRSTSLLTHLGLKRRLPLMDTALAASPPGVISINAGLCTLEFDLDTPGRILFRPPLDDLSDDRQHPPACFDDWWLLPVLEDAAGRAFNRRDLVLSVADQDGGAHVDASLNPSYAALSRNNSIGFGQAGDQPNSAILSVAFEGLSRVPDDAQEPLANSVALASVRQIAFEVLSSIERAVEDDGNSLRLKREICPIPFAEAPDVGRNDACLCGSGRSYKKCFGIREPRRSLQLPAF
jgi:hypothetical protein